MIRISAKEMTAVMLLLMGYLWSPGAAFADKDSQQSPQYPSQHFRDHLNSAEKFWQAIKDGEKAQKQGSYDEAITSFKEALEVHAYLRPEQSIASTSLAKAYLEMGDDDTASKYYDMASELTMNEYGQVEFRAKSQELLQLIIDQGGTPGPSPDRSLPIKETDRLIRKAFSLKNRQKIEEAISQYEELKNHGEYYERFANHELSKCYDDLGRHQEAAEAYGQYFEKLDINFLKEPLVDYDRLRLKAGLEAFDVDAYKKMMRKRYARANSFWYRLFRRKE